MSFLYHSTAGFVSIRLGRGFGRLALFSDNPLGVRQTTIKCALQPITERHHDGIQSGSGTH